MGLKNNSTWVTLYRINKKLRIEYIELSNLRLWIFIEKECEQTENMVLSQKMLILHLCFTLSKTNSLNNNLSSSIQLRIIKSLDQPLQSSCRKRVLIVTINLLISIPIKEAW